MNKGQNGWFCDHSFLRLVAQNAHHTRLLAMQRYEHRIRAARIFIAASTAQFQRMLVGSCKSTNNNDLKLINLLKFSFYFLKWLLDVVICNGLGIYLGMKTCEYFTMKPYYWRGLWNIPTFSGKLKRIVGQFSPYNWIPYDWRPTSSLKRWLYMLLLMTFFFTAELGTFYLKYILWVPPPHFLCLGRLVFMWLVGAVAMRETFEFMDNP